MRRLATTFALLPSLLFTSVAQAQELVFGFGHADFLAEQADDGAYLSADYLGTRDWRLLGFDAGLGVTALVHETGDIFLGGGLQAQRDLGQRWFIEASVMPGAFFEGEKANDLGSTFEIRSLVGIGRELRGGRRLTLAFTHISNASIGDQNPGLNAISLRLHVPLRHRARN
ncbi:acyloxyacyl hydrolase [Tritonibacter scottomollicae]|uniref:Lipid A 3-O-deacylase PagL n=1 Tax=Tritonibacter scottomollicae TaxID=483013 RepID=A0A2T1APD7_TRISK|nr:acyloxyacyl hydrolase [Tritonibacter scottomollicae]PRZ50178.1 lipid A 3-O-deacylase PagL [Tritonibacter scottomollicae]